MNILLVDDENRSRLHVAEFLRKLGHSVIEAADGKRALELFSSQDFDLLLTDNRMPRMSGLELMDAIRSLPSSENLDMVLFTAYGDMQSTLSAMRAGASDYLLKPLNIDELVSMIERIARQRIERNKTKPQANAQFPGKDLQPLLPEKMPLDHMSPAPISSIVLNETGIFAPSMRKAFELSQKLHTCRSIPVLIEGETGTGKELIARCIHDGNGHNDLPFVALNCAALNANIFESELFGYEPGAFSGGLSSGKSGKLDMAQGGTLFLDEISEMPLNLQAKLLRVLQEKEYYRVGGLTLIKTDVRIICACNKYLEDEVKQGLFRQDLYFRLNAGYICVPPLRERPEDVIPLARMFLRELCAQHSKPCICFSPSAIEMLLAYAWPGNVRELRNTMEWLVLMEYKSEISARDLQLILDKRTQTNKNHANRFKLDAEALSLPTDGTSLNKLSNSIILKALAMHNGNKSETAKYLNISRSSLYNHLRQMEGS